MCDETFAINSTAKIPAGIDRGWFYFWVTLCNQLYWVTGATLGGLIGAHLPFNTDGLDFVLTALFLVIFLDQWARRQASRATVRRHRCADITGLPADIRGQ